MALDKQKILSELGSVVNQLQSADCGCMGKLFNNQGQGSAMNSAMPLGHGCRHVGCCHGGCHHGYGACGEPHSMHRPMGSCCNPPKLYADTYNYLTENLMQPVVKEVYDDLRTINPTNTIMNSPLGALMGTNATSMGGGMTQMQPMNPNAAMGNGMNNIIGSMGNYNAAAMQSTGNQNMTGAGSKVSEMSHHGQMNPMAGMGPQIMGMMGGDKAIKPNQTAGQTQPLSGQMNAPQSPQGKGGLMPNAGGATMMNPPTQYVTQDGTMMMLSTQMGNTTMSQNAPIAQIPQGMHNPTMQYMTASGGMNNLEQAGVSPNQQMGNLNQSPPAQQMAVPHNQNYGVHGQGMAKFHEMFPGVMQGLGGNLNFDPMALAIQMNPVNQKKTAMNNLRNIMMNPGGGANKHLAQPVQSGVNGLGQQPKLGQVNATPGYAIAQPNEATLNQQQMMKPQQMYTALTGQPILNQQVPMQQQIPQQAMPQAQPTQQYQQQPQSTNQQYVDPNTSAISSSLNISPNNVPMNAQNPSSEVPDTATQQMIEEHNIFPVDTSKNQQQVFYEYNTLGQPVQRLPAHVYRAPIPNLPQTLSPSTIVEPIRSNPNANVKSTISKTSLFGNKFGARTSRSQLKHVYNQYRGSQSLTHQNLPNNTQGGSSSVGKLNTAPADVNPMRVPVERKGGDTIANNQAAMNQKASYQVEQVKGQIGDVQVAKPQPDGDSSMPMKKIRNGLQDMNFINYKATPSWSLHGRRLPQSMGAHLYC